MTNGSSPRRRGRIVRLPRLSEPAEPTLLPRVAVLARLMAERLVGDTLAKSDEALVHFAAQVLEEARGSRPLKLSCAPAEADRLARNLDALGVAGDVVITGDEELPAGALRLETDIGHLEASVAGALDALTVAARFPPR